MEQQTSTQKKGVVKSIATPTKQNHQTSWIDKVTGQHTNSVLVFIMFLVVLIVFICNPHIILLPLLIVLARYFVVSAKNKSNSS